MQKGKYYLFKLNQSYGNIYNGNVKSTPFDYGRIIYNLIPDQHIQILNIVDHIWCYIQYYNHYKKSYITGYIMYKIINYKECNPFGSTLIYIDNPYFQLLEKFGLEYDELNSLNSFEYSNIIIQSASKA